jgi:cell division protein FtsA
MQKSGPVYVGIDIGTTNVRTVVGIIGDDDLTPTIVGAGSSLNRGMRKGTINNVEEVANAINLSVEEAERISGQSVSSATVSVNGPHIVSLNSKGVIAISGQLHEITEDDLQRVEEAASVVQLPANREILQVFAKSYSLDGQENIKEPLGMSGVRLEVDAHIVTAATPALKNIDKTLDVARIGINHHILAGLAASESVLEPKQRESGVAVVDIGSSTTNILVVEDDDVQFAAVLPVGSNNLTNDLAIGLKTDLDVAEVVKLQHSSAIGTEKKTRKHFDVVINEQTYSFERELVDDIVTARLDEMFDLVSRELRKINREGKLPGGIVLVGGGALLPGIDEYVKNRMMLPAKVGRPKNYSGIIDTTNSPEYAVAVGLMMLDMNFARAYGGHLGGGMSGLNIADSIKGILKKFRA